MQTTYDSVCSLLFAVPHKQIISIKEDGPGDPLVLYVCLFVILFGAPGLVALVALREV